ncbi:hypothetical protein TNCV_4622261 [Trichonephila clavipes]|nr:hypothetical protein TNCV_4622261 [Trichonephila clavipes]
MEALHYSSNMNTINWDEERSPILKQLDGFKDLDESVTLAYHVGLHTTMSYDCDLENYGFYRTAAVLYNILRREYKVLGSRI